MLTYFVKRVRKSSKSHVAAVQRRLRNVQKSVMHVQSSCFADINLLLFPVLFAVPTSLLKLPIDVIQKFCYYGNVTSHFSLFLEVLVH